MSEVMTMSDKEIDATVAWLRRFDRVNGKSRQAADMLLALKARAEKAESECQDHMNAIAYTTAQLGTVARRAEAAEKRIKEMEAALLVAVDVMHNDGVDMDAYPEVVAALEAKPTPE